MPRNGLSKELDGYSVVVALARFLYDEVLRVRTAGRGVREMVRRSTREVDVSPAIAWWLNSGGWDGLRI
jgi:hypothetical protein